ncbi:Ocs element-binding factor 1 [Hordeum vulgare]|uniref:Predicted protein n=1 Tax=Hordeum vulgare subsp. vulgare TaxID=112509 RepID=F2E7M3_HORVV|nr:bZIP transcription factor 68-like [Hordeum vulgare subsp. vulgare]KAE8789086.1 Ocs element-binding factor 1 [Hordeum vulgare]BAK03345.1 predicted protein [Hordeum vulgare subsp. vulgare]
MQRHGAACGIACHSGAGLAAAGVFMLPQVYDPHGVHGQYQYDLASLSDMVAPYTDYNGGNPAVGWVPPGGGAVDDDGRTACRGNGDERKTRRLASNRESARRSRVRKQRRLDELSSRAARLRAENQRLLVELNGVLAEHGRVARESARLREEASELRAKLDGMGVDEADVDVAPQSTEDTGNTA